MAPGYQNKDLNFEYSNNALCVKDYYGDGTHLKMQVTTKMIENIFGDQNICEFTKWCREPNAMGIGCVWSVALQTHFGGLTTTEVLTKLRCLVGLIYGIFKDQKEQTKNKYLYSHAVMLLEKYHKQSTGRAKGLLVWILDHLSKFKFLCNAKKVRFDPTVYIGRPYIQDESKLRPRLSTNGSAPEKHATSYAGYWILIVLLIVAIIYIYMRKMI